MQVTEVRVMFRKTLSDGSYGNETHEVSYVARLDEGDQDATQLEYALAARAREFVLAQFRLSPSEGIQWAIQTPEEREAARERERAEYEARQAARRAADVTPDGIPF